MQYNTENIMIPTSEWVICREGRTMPNRCVAYGCQKTHEDNVTLFKFPKESAEYHIWEKQVQRTRNNWTAKSTSHLCSDHFGKDCFEPKPSAAVKGTVPKVSLKLKEGSVPTVFIRPPCSSCGGDGRDCSTCTPRAKKGRNMGNHKDRTTLEGPAGTAGPFQRSTGGLEPEENDDDDDDEDDDDDDDDDDEEENEEAVISPTKGPASPSKVSSPKEDEPAVCEMCGIVGTKDTFYSKTKRFCSVSCSRSYSSNSKKASILARLQVRAQQGAAVCF
ncbi:hypothetical protein SKAU_G00121060 [Synaphobranchus kaupii]|uniref:THAP domain-containing protein 1 n=1 Tax=Synaphobranchus kaupii TaxID=118154 RepID=A0A9Q1J2I6_SYNKA|nr:hypothetical protein SKAU_G00121060 [Synaphobranchus kaupii]